MAITRLICLKEGKSSPGISLKNCIDYILDKKNNGKKTEIGLWVGGNSGAKAEDIFQTMIDTKKEWEKELGRQGYHFVLSFAQEERVDEQKAFDVIKEFCEKYLGDDYDYVFAIHNDQAHMHGHIVFNSVARKNGYKYRYVKGDWEKYIQPVTDAVCKKHGLKELVYEEKKGKSYAEHMAKKAGKGTGEQILKDDIDYAIAVSENYEEFFQKMDQFGYQVDFGQSITHGEYMTLRAPGAKKGRRNYKLGEGYSLTEIKQRIKKEYRTQLNKAPAIKIKQVNLYKGATMQLSRFQVRQISRLHKANWYRRLNSYANIDPYQVRKDLLHIERVAADCRYIVRHNLQTEQDLLGRKKALRLDKKALGESLSHSIHIEKSLSEIQGEIRIINRLLRENRNINELKAVVMQKQKGKVNERRKQK